MDDALISTVLDAAEADASLSEQVRLLVLAALDSDELLTAAVDSGTDIVSKDQLLKIDEKPPIGAYLKSIKVSGFRGVGPAVTLSLQPTPGLSVIAGRNGSGKSSIAEALELALTGASYRWANKSVLWKESWRNLHSEAPPEIRIELAEEGAGLTTVGLDWGPSAGLDEQKTWVQRAGKPRESGLGSLGWSTALELYRPLLSYDELGGRLEAKPSDLHDALEKILGLQRITDAQNRLTTHHKKVTEPQLQAKTLLPNLKAMVASSDDPRAAAVAALLAKRSPDVNALAHLTKTENVIADSEITYLRALSRLPIPNIDDAVSVANSLETSVQQVAELANSTIEGLAQRIEILQLAIKVQTSSGVQPCPVCGEGTLDDAWVEHTKHVVENSVNDLKDFNNARTALIGARNIAQRLITQAPTLPQAVGTTMSTLPAAQAALQKWTTSPESDLDLVRHLRENVGPLTSAIDDLKTESAMLLEDREDRWSPVALKLAEWVSLAREAASRSDVSTQLDRASKWLKAHASQLRNDRLKPIAEQARHIWSTLRQESNVDLGSINLAGQANRRHVDLRAEVDGTETGALGVMSQGELHALALSLFLPRATMAASPFRFIVLDDPIQAMDPAKVEGFVQVLQKLSTTHQVIVLSHDDRLPDSIRHSGTEARILEVSRGRDSRISITNAVDPASRYLDDAWAIAKDDNVPAPIKDKVTPNLCRMALESACRDVFMAKSFSAGKDRVTVEEMWLKEKTTRKRLALALNLDAGPPLESWLNGLANRRAALTVCGRKAHEGSSGHHLDEIKDVKATIDQVRQTEW